MRRTRSGVAYPVSSTLVERTTGYTMLLHLPEGYRPEQVRDALAAKIQALPETLRGSLTWDQGPEMRDWHQVAVAAGIDIFFYRLSAYYLICRSPYDLTCRSAS